MDDTLLVTLLFSSWINLVLFAAQIILSLLFLRRSRGCTLHQGLVVIGALVADTVCTVAVCANTLLYTVIFPSTECKILDGLDPGNFPSVQIWTLPVIIVSSAFPAFLEHWFLARRYWNLSRNRYISTLFVLLIACHTTLWCSSGIYIAVHPQIEQNFATTATLISTSLAAATDILLALLMVVQLYSFQTEHVSAQQLIRRVSWISISAGALCAMTSTLMLAFWIKQDPVFTVFMDCMGRVYSLTILSNFLTVGTRSETVDAHHTTDLVHPLTQISCQPFDFTLPDIDSSIVREMEVSNIESTALTIDSKSDKVTLSSDPV